MARIKRGDIVTVVCGKDKGKSGKVLCVFPLRNSAVVERVNMVKHFERRTQQNQTGGIIEREGALSLSNLALACPRCRQSSKTGWQVTGKGPKQRICRRCKEPI